mgnify:CR=1 FL=1
MLLRGSIEDRLKDRALRSLREKRGLRKPLIEDIFNLRTYISPTNLHVQNYLKHTPSAAFNPGALLQGNKLLLFPRLIFDYNNYVSSIGFTTLGIEEVLTGTFKTPLYTKIILWPTYIWEFRGCEDARIFEVDSDIYILYTGYGYLPHGGELNPIPVQGVAKIDKNLKLKYKGYFVIEGRGGRFIPRSHKDSAFVRINNEEAVILTRPSINGIDICWRGIASLNELIIYEETLSPVISFEPWELKVGWSTNVVKLSSNEYLVGWHAVLREDLSYRNGLAIVDDQGELLAISNYLLAPQGLIESYGDRPLVIFGNGLVIYRDILIWIGGISDYAIGVFATDLYKALEKLIWIRG